MSLQMSHAAAIIADSAAVEAVVAARASTGILSVASSESKPRGEVIALSWARELLAGNDTVPAGSRSWQLHRMYSHRFQTLGSETLSRHC